MRHLLILLLLVHSSGCSALIPTDTLPQLQSVLPDTVFGYYEQQPEFRGGQEGLYRYLAVNVHYPNEARERHLAGKVFVSFKIDTSGAVSDVKLMKGIGGGCDEEAVRVIAQMPNWIPGKVGNRTVATLYNLPIFFSEEEQALRILLRKWFLASEESPTQRGKRVAPTLQIHGQLALLYGYRPDKGEPLWLLNGHELTPEARAALNPATIKTLTVIRRSEATELYGERGKTGVVQLVSL
jgi:TonB family protein